MRIYTTITDGEDNTLDISGDVHKESCGDRGFYVDDVKAELDGCPVELTPQQMEAAIEKLIEESE